MVELTTLFGLAQTLAIIVGVIIALMELGHMRQTRDTELETRQAQLFMQIHDRFNDTEFVRQYTKVIYEWEWRDYDDYRKKYGDPESRSTWLTVARFFRGLGVLVDRKLIDIKLVYDLMPAVVIRAWEKMGPIRKEERERTRNPQLGRLFEYLYNEIKKMEEQLAQTNE